MERGVEITRLGCARPAARERVHLGPEEQAKSVVMTEEGVKQAKELFERHFGSAGRSARQR